MRVREQVTYIDEDGDELDAFVKGVVIDGHDVAVDDSGDDPSPDLNLYFLTKDPKERDKRGLQPIMKTFVPHISRSKGKVKCWKEWRTIIPGGGNGE